MKSIQNMSLREETYFYLKLIRLFVKLSGMDRGMKKWLPFASLVEQGKFLEQMIYQKYKVEKPLVFNEQCRKINNILLNYDYKTPLNLKIYYDGYIYQIQDTIIYIDIKKKVAYFDNFYLPLKNIIDIEDQSSPFDVIC